MSDMENDKNYTNSLIYIEKLCKIYENNTKRMDAKGIKYHKGKNPPTEFADGDLWSDGHLDWCRKASVIYKEWYDPFMVMMSVPFRDDDVIVAKHSESCVQTVDEPHPNIKDE